MTTEEKNELYNAAQVIVALKYPKMPRKQALACAGQLADKRPHLCRQYIERAAELDQLFNGNPMDIIYCGLPNCSLNRGMASCPACLELREQAGRESFFSSHRCYRCKDGALPCIQGGRHLCHIPRARND